MSTSPLYHSLNISNVQNVGTPLVYQVSNQFDEHGALLGLTRLRGEKNWEYKRRILDVFTHIANSSYRGLVHGITRELGLELTPLLEIGPKLNESGQIMCKDPYVVFDGIWLRLYSDYTNGILDWEIDRYQMGGNFEHLGRLVDMVNTTNFFYASIKDNADPFIRSMTILNQSNREQVTFEMIPSTNRFRLDHQYPAKGTIYFSNRIIFKTEVSSSRLVLSEGQYHIDYNTGIVTSYSIPSQLDYVRYQYNQIPFVALSSPIILHDINDDNFRVKMFEQVLLDNGVYTHGLPTELGVDIINELLSVTPMYWGV